MVKEVAAITGGTSGLGKACVERFVKDGYEVSIQYSKRMSGPLEPFCIICINLRLYFVVETRSLALPLQPKTIVLSSNAMSLCQNKWNRFSNR